MSTALIHLRMMAIDDDAPTVQPAVSEASVERPTLAQVTQLDDIGQTSSETTQRILALSRVA